MMEHSPDFNRKMADALEAAYEKAKHTPTNADRIRAMSDEAMMEYMYHNCHCPPELDELPSCPYRKKNRVQTKDCRTCWLDWLKQEARDD